MSTGENGRAAGQMLLLFLDMMLLLTLWLARADAGDNVSEEAGEARKDLIDVAGKTAPADEQMRGEVATASKRRPEDTECAFIVLLLPLLLLDGTYCAVHLGYLVDYRQMPQQLPDTNRVEQRVVGAGVCPPA